MGILSGGPGKEGAPPGKTHMEITGLRKRWPVSYTHLTLPTTPYV